jgi:hypothetical protein
LTPPADPTKADMVELEVLLLVNGAAAATGTVSRIGDSSARAFLAGAGRVGFQESCNLLLILYMGP